MIDLEGLRDPRLQAFGDLGDLVLCAGAVEKDREFVAAETCDDVARPDAGFELLRDRNQQLVADSMAEAVVDQLKAVEIEKEHRKPGVRVTLCLFDSLLEVVHELHPVGQISKRIVQSVVAQLLLGTAAFCDIAKGGYAADRLILEILRLRI